MGLAGYLSFRGDTDGEILENFSGPYIVPFNILLIVHITLYIPVDFVIMRYSVVKLMQIHEDQHELKLKWHVLITCVVLYGKSLIIFIL